MISSLAVARVLAFALAPAASPAADRHECVQPIDGCGCALTIDGAQCPGGLAHFARELMDGAPLRYSVLGSEVFAKSRIAPSDTFSHERNQAWSERYTSDLGTIDVHYRPAPSTCRKVGEPCEYFDVRAKVIFQPIARPAYALRTTGVCGC